MVILYIDNQKIAVEKGLTVLQACEKAGIQIPRFCYHDKLSIAGNCRMCLVEVKNSVKPVAACAVTVQESMKIFTDTELVLRARQGVLEFLLANHPLDCPICDQGGECDLQDQALFFGNDRGRFYELKRSVQDKNCGPLVKTIMTRCIHCTRCVRFSKELSGLNELSTTGRGNQTEIGNYISKSILSEVSGNIIDLCPVGALTSKPYSFMGRSWELRRVDTIDLSDSMCSNISVHTNKQRILRVLPILHEGINEEWIHDKTRFSYDGLRVQRLLRPFIFSKNHFSNISWKQSLISFSYSIMNYGSVGYTNFILGNQGSLESSYECLQLSYINPYIQFYFQDLLTATPTDFRSYYLFNQSYAGLSTSDFCLMLGANLKKEAPLLLMRLRAEQKKRSLIICCFGSEELAGLQVYNVGNTFQILLNFLEGKHSFCSLFARSNFPSILIGNGLLGTNFKTTVSSTLFYRLNQLKKNFSSLNFIYFGVQKINNFELGNGGVSRLSTKNSQNVVLDNANENLLVTNNFNSFFIGSHGGPIMESCKVIFPITIGLETEATYINGEGRSQKSSKVLSGGELSKSESVLFQLINQLFKEKFLLKTLLPVQEGFGQLNAVGYSTFLPVLKPFKNLIPKGIMGRYVSNFYQTDSISFSSKTMHLCKKNLNTRAVFLYKFF